MKPNQRVDNPTAVQKPCLCLAADLHADVRLLQQLRQSAPPQFAEVFVSEGKTVGWISAQQYILQTLLLKNQPVFL